MDLPTFSSLNVTAVLPVVLLSGWALLLLVFDLFIPNERRYWTAWLGILGLVAAGVILLLQASRAFGPSLGVTAFEGMLLVDGFAVFLQLLFVLAAIVGILLALNYLPRRGIHRGEYYSLLLFSTVGMMLMALAADLVVVFLALELLSIPLYILSGFARPEPRSEEAAMKYFLLGAFSSSFLVYGIALTYGGTGTTHLSGVLDVLSGSAPNLPVAIAGMALILVGLSFKVAAVPFHMWTPDVYEGAPTSVTAFMSVGAKAGGFAAMLRLLVTAMPTISEEWGTLITIIAMLTMILGNVVAISQRNIKRMLAYSSIAHAGYVLLAVAAAQRALDAPLAVAAAIFYLLTYTFTNLGAFAIVIARENDDGTGTDISDFAGLGREHLPLGIAMTLFMLSLTGMPISAGLVGKFFIFQSAIQAAVGNPWLLAAAIVGVVTSVISAFYYMRVVLVMFMQEGDPPVRLQPALTLAVILMAAGTFLLGVLPGPLFNLAREAMFAVAG